MSNENLRTRIAAVAEAHEPCGLPGGIDCNCGQGFRPDSGSWVERAVEARQLWSQHLADAVISELKLEALELLARSWYRNYDIIPANDPRCPTDMDIAYDDAGEQILRALGLLHE